MTNRHARNRGIIDAMALLSVPEAAAQSGLSRSYIRRLVSKGALKGQRVGNSWGVNESSLRAFLAKDRKPGPKPRGRRQNP